MGLLPEFNTRIRALMAAAQEAGQDPRIVSGYRSEADQARAINSVSQRVNGRPASIIDYSRGIPGYAAPVGGSMHQRGEAVDFGTGPSLDWMRQNAASYGVRFPERLAKSDPAHAAVNPDFWGPVQDPNDRGLPVAVPPSSQPDPAKTANYQPKRGGMSAAQPMMMLGGPKDQTAGAPEMALYDPQSQQGFSLDNWVSSPLFQMGAGVLGAPNIGEGLMQGSQAASQMQTAGLRNNALRQQMEQKRRQEAAWNTMFAGGQPNMAHPMLKDLPPDMVGLAQVMGPEAGLSALQEYAMKRHGSELARRAEVEKIKAVKDYESEMKAKDLERMMGALSPMFGGQAAPASSISAPSALAPPFGQTSTPMAGTQIVPQQTASLPQAPTTAQPGNAIQPTAPAFDDNMKRLAIARLQLGDSKGALEIYEKALEAAQVPGREAAKTLAVERSKTQAGDEKSTKAARDMWGLLDTLDRAGNALGGSRLEAAASPTLDSWFGRNVLRYGQDQAYNDRLKLKGMADSIVLQARETQRGLGQLTEGEQATLERAYTGMMSATSAEDLRQGIETVRYVLSKKIPEQSTYVPSWITKLEGEQKARQEKTAASPAAPTRQDMRPPTGEATRSVDTLSADLNGKDVYDSKTGQWGKVLNGEFVSRRQMMQGEAKRKLLQGAVN